MVVQSNVCFCTLLHVENFSTVRSVPGTYDLFVPGTRGTDRTTAFSSWARRSSESRTLVHQFHFSETLICSLSIRDYILVNRQHIHPVLASCGPSKHPERFPSDFHPTAKSETLETVSDQSNDAVVSVRSKLVEKNRSYLVSLSQ